MKKMIFFLLSRLSFHIKIYIIKKIIHMKKLITEQYSKLYKDLLDIDIDKSFNREIHDCSLKFSICDGLPLTKRFSERREHIFALNKDFVNENWDKLESLKNDTFANVVPYQIFETSYMDEKERIREWCRKLDKDKSYGEYMDHIKLNDLDFASKYLNMKIFISEINFNKVADEISNNSLLLIALAEKLNMIPNSIKIFLGECSMSENEMIIFQELNLHKI
jgi:hypothetical protein